MEPPSTRIHTRDAASLEPLKDATIAVIGYGNQGRAQALNLRDSGLQIIIGNRHDEYRETARKDGFEVFDIATAVAKAVFILLLIPDETLPLVFEGEIRPNLRTNNALVFASGYSLAFDQISPTRDVDLILVAPRMIGVGVRERYLTQEGFYCLVGVHQDASGKALDRTLALTLGISGLYKPAIQVSFKQEAILDLFNEQAFGPAFGRVLLTAIAVLVENGLPPEAILTEMYLSEEMAYTYKKMARVGLVRQTLYHSQTSQYGAMSRGTRFLGMGLKGRMQKIYQEIATGAFAREWDHPLSRLKFKAIRFFAMRQSINKLEKRVRETLALRDLPPFEQDPEIERILGDPDLQEALKEFEDGFEF
jgi:ketol-acid reductoisomerase